MAKNKSALGRGLGALIDHTPENTEIVAGSIYEIAIEEIEANPYQPREKFDAEALTELSNSIKQMGIIQPITVRMMDDKTYQLISGERRLRASKLAGLEKIPAYIRKADDQGMLEMALVENVQREDLDSIEVALSYQRLIDECSLTQEEMSDRVGKKRSTISNYLRLLRLPAKIQLGIREKQISMGHARALINVEDPEMQIMIYEQILRYDFSVRKVEDVVREIKEGTEKKKSKGKTMLTEDYVLLKEHLVKFFNTAVDFKRNDDGKGKIVIPFTSDKDLERIIGIFDKLNS